MVRVAEQPQAIKHASAKGDLHDQPNYAFSVECVHLQCLAGVDIANIYLSVCMQMM